MCTLCAWEERLFMRTQEKKQNKTLVIAICCIAAAIVLLAVILGATGMFSGSSGDESDLSSQVKALKSDEYKAASEYNKYLQGLTDEELEKVTDASGDSVYEAPEKIKEICEKYDLKYAGEMTDLLSWNSVEKALKERELTGIMSSSMEKDMKATIEEYGGGYSFDDGNLQLELEAKTEKGGLYFLSMTITPEGAFPWQAYGTEDFSSKSGGKLFTWEAESGDVFACKTDTSEGTAFGKAGGYYVTLDLSKSEPEDSDQEAEMTKEELENWLSQIDFSKF